MGGAAPTMDAGAGGSNRRNWQCREVVRPHCDGRTDLVTHSCVRQVLQKSRPGDVGRGRR
jgi:hypothetical protein